MLLDKEILLSPAEWELWKNHPITQLVLQALSDERSMWVQDLAMGYTLERVGCEIIDTAKTVGIVAGLSIVLEDLELKLQQQWAEVAERKAEEEESEL